MSNTAPSIQESPTVGEYMTKQPATVDSGLQILDALDRMYSDGIRHLPVVDEAGSLVGMLSSRDIANVATHAPWKVEKTTVAEVMAKEPFHCSAETALTEVALEMETKKIGSTVITVEDRPVGIFTTSDALRAVRSLVAGEFVESANPPHHILTEEEAAAGKAPHIRRSAPRATKLGWALFPG